MVDSSGAAELLVAAAEPVAEGVLLLTLADPEERPLAPWTPGAHVDLLLDNGLVRSYSLCGDPADPYRYQVAVLLDPQSRGGSAFVHRELATPGTRVRVGLPRNHFALAPAERYLFVAGGIGITPLLPMIRAAEATRADWRLVYAGRSLAAMAFRDELARSYGEGRVTLAPKLETGRRPDLAALLAEAAAEGRTVYCCGPERMVDAVAAACAGWPEGRLRTERFRAEVSADGSEFEVELARSGLSAKVPDGLSILDALEDAGFAEAAFSCREGTCGSCETRVLAGEPDHRDAVLSEAERETAETMMICVSRARTPHLVLDL
ncbi:PDR/VanB family oxidoreductase [Streptacidiphilus monticola]|uniref:PDR/VanB family oxidoreductase n=1 Tax=Streptacidiphilus monticola TaxID=2161674 RepID=A0ABW1FX28_9ACTN